MQEGLWCARARSGEGARKAQVFRASSTRRSGRDIGCSKGKMVKKGSCVTSNEGDIGSRWWKTVSSPGKY